MINKRKSIGNIRLSTTQSKNGIHLKRKETLNVKIKDGQCNRCSLWKRGDLRLDGAPVGVLGSASAPAGLEAFLCSGRRAEDELGWNWSWLNYFWVDEVFFLPRDLLSALLWELIVMAILCGGNFVEGQSTEVSMLKLRSNGTMGRTEGICQSKLPNAYPIFPS